jgi:hypothetical protein
MLVGERIRRRVVANRQMFLAPGGRGSIKIPSIRFGDLLSRVGHSPLAPSGSFPLPLGCLDI